MAAPVRARDLRDNIKTYGYEHGTVITLELLLDEFAEMRQHMRQITELLAQAIDNVQTLANVSEGMSKHIDQIKRDQTGGENAE